jgi:CBS domain containing-hemolysin-like protein
MTLLILYLFLALGLSFLCSLLESVILSVTRSHINLMIKERKRGGKLLRALKLNIDRPLAAILTVNTIANTVGAAGVGVQVLKIYDESWVAIASGTLTFSILVFSEIIPKSIGAANWKRLAAPCALLTKILITTLLPIVWFLEQVSSLTSPKGKDDESMTREEMIVAAETGVEEGILVEKETRIIKNLLRLNAILAEDVMTPRSVVFSLQKNRSVDDILEKDSPIFFSRIPVHDKGIDDIVGMVLRFKIIEASSDDRHDMKISELLLPIHKVHEKRSVASILDELIKRREHLFLVVDEHGKTSGIITLEDVIETLLGVEIVDEFDSVEDMRKFALEQWENRKKSRKYAFIGSKASTVNQKIK